MEVMRRLPGKGWEISAEDVAQLSPCRLRTSAGPMRPGMVLQPRGQVIGDPAVPQIDRTVGGSRFRRVVG
ncbi:hypothetical protein ACFOY2_50085 [Nonomuraea purpurea]|uniref:Uncharacterized protein n=1 Tax=Nonomuraea purpurea TaxID=1849276 RepID=A0ABV8GP38_9ACTN